MGHASERDGEMPRLAEAAEAVWFVPKANGVTAHYAFEYPNGPGNYLNLWLDDAGFGLEQATWNSVLPGSAILLWRNDD